MRTFYKDVTLDTIKSAEYLMTDSSGKIVNGLGDFGALNLITTGTLGAGAITGTSLTDGTATLDDGSLTGAVNGTFSGTVQAEHLYTTDDLQVGDDILLGSGAVFNWDSGDVTLTHSANTLTLDGGNLVFLDNIHLYLGTGSDIDMYYSATAGIFNNLDVTVANTTGKLQYYANFVPTGNYAASKGNLFSSTIDYRSATNVSGTYVCGSNLFSAAFQWPNMPMTGQISTFTYTGTSFTNTINGNSVAGFNSGTGNLTGVGLDVDFTGNFSTAIGGFNFYPIVFDIDFTATSAASHQISGLDLYVTYNTTSTTNQLYGMRIFPEAIGGMTVGGPFTGIYIDLITVAATFNDPVAYYRAYFNNSYDSAFNTNIAAAADPVIGFWAEDNGGGWAMAGHDTYGFYSTLVNNAKNFSFVSTGADGWMKGDNVAFGFGTGYDAEISFTGTVFLIQADLITATDILRLRAGTNGLSMYIGATEQVILTDGVFKATTTNDIDLGDTTHFFKDSFLGRVYLEDTSTYFDNNGGDIDVYTAANKTIELQTVVYDDMQFNVSGAKVPAANYPNWEAFTTNTFEYAFDVDEYINCSANELPHWWKQGTAGDVHIHLTLKSANSTGADRFAKFEVIFAYADSNEVWVEQTLTAEITIATGTAALTNLYLDLGNLTFTNYLIGAQVRCRPKRIAATGGTEFADSIFITQVGVHLQKDTMGSRQEAVK